MKKYFFITLFRSIKNSIGRYLALFAICALGVGFFAGFKNVQPLMISSAQDYLDEKNAFDLQIISTWGLRDDDLNFLADIDGVTAAEGCFSSDAYAIFKTKDYGAKVLTLPTAINTLDLIYGRYPTAPNECVADANFFGKNDIGKPLILTDEKGGKTLSNFTTPVYTVVGIVRSPLYISHERGISSLEFGRTDFFVYLPNEACCADYFTQVYMTVDTDLPQFDEEYETAVKDKAEQVKLLFKDKYAPLVEWLIQLSPETDPGFEAYVLTQRENEGLARYSQDTGIVDGIANVFPAFFALVAALVCLSTVTRMVSEERTQIGTLKALGYGNFSIASKYVCYVLSAGLLGAVGGFFLGTWGLPKIVTLVYRTIYVFCDYKYVFSWLMLGLCLAVVAVAMTLTALAASLSTTRANAAEAMRPKAPKAGKRTFVEKIPFIWNNTSFIGKVTLRNMLLDKKRMIMALVGISGCTALLLASFSVRNNVIGVLDDEYGDIIRFDLSVTLSNGERPTFDFAEKTFYVYSDTVQLTYDGLSDRVSLFGYEDESFADMFKLYKTDKTTPVPLPSDGEAVISNLIAKEKNIRTGDVISLTVGGKEKTFSVSEIFNNYIGDYVIISMADLSDVVKVNSAYLQLPDGYDETEIETRLKAIDGVVSFTFIEEAKAPFAKSLSSMNYVVAVLIVCSALLAFVVLYNLTNINIMERRREIATVRVLGFYPKETDAYILRENVILAIFGGIVGLALGVLLNNFVIANLLVEGVCFNNAITPLSFLFAYALTLIFTLLTNRIMSHKLESVNMAEALKSVE